MGLIIIPNPRLFGLGLPPGPCILDVAGTKPRHLGSNKHVRPISYFVLMPFIEVLFFFFKFFLQLQFLIYFVFHFSSYSFSFSHPKSVIFFFGVSESIIFVLIFDFGHFLFCVILFVYNLAL
jgi:hypothetical protein